MTNAIRNNTRAGELQRGGSPALVGLAHLSGHSRRAALPASPSASASWAIGPLMAHHEEYGRRFELRALGFPALRLDAGRCKATVTERRKLLGGGHGRQRSHRGLPLDEAYAARLGRPGPM
ncbi:MAG: hypothetical protein LBD02_03325 [Christensenellaceae bacterium]|jgi:hypothetical protein|nr:hypothetical protein [Christensenellaceae bacterium]